MHPAHAAADAFPSFSGGTCTQFYNLPSSMMRDPSDAAGIEHKYVVSLPYGAGFFKVQFIVLDPYWYMSTRSEEWKHRTIFGDEQFEWLRQSLHDPADLRFIVWGKVSDGKRGRERAVLLGH